MVLLGRGGWLASARAEEETNAPTTGLGPEFTSATEEVNGKTLHYVRGGKGAPVILIHGFPQDWFEYHAIMPQLAKKFTVIAVDLPGIGGSTATAGAYDAGSMAEDIHQLAVALKMKHVYVVGHDVGGMVAYAFVRRYPSLTRGAMFLDAPLPGIDGWDEVQTDPTAWHIRFQQVPGLAEKLVIGRQAEYFGYFFAYSKFTPGEVAHYLFAYSQPSQLHAAFEIYRAFPANEIFNMAQLGTNTVPIFVAAGDGSPFAKLVPKMAVGLRAKGCANVATGLIRGSGHYILQDQPEPVAQLIEKQATLRK